VRALAVIAVVLVSVGLSFAQGPSTTFVFVRIQDKVEPVERGAKYEDPLNAALVRAKLGAVTGGGTMMNKDKTIDWVGVDVELVDLRTGIPFLLKKLRELGAPPGSAIEYEEKGQKTTIPVH
jgi:hypothetical protein